MMAPIFFKPGQELKTYEVFRRKAKRDSRGRVTVETQPELIDAVRGTIARARSPMKITAATTRRKARFPTCPAAWTCWCWRKRYTRCASI